MKKMICAILALTISMTALPVFASDLSVVMIDNSSEALANSVSLDDMQLGTSYPIDGYAKVQPLEFAYYDFFAQFGEKEDYGCFRNADFRRDHVGSYSDSRLEYQSWRFNDASWMESGDSAQFAWLAMDITNLQKSAVDFSEEMSVKVVYQDDYEFVGWVRQIDTDLINKETSDCGVSRNVGEKTDYPNTIVLNPEKMHAVDMLYTGHYVIGCTLPNSVFEDSKSPLRIEISLGGNDLTYNIIK